MLVDEDGELYRLFEANGTPSAVVVAPDGSIGSRVASGPDRIAQLVATMLDVPGLPVGASVPSLELPSLEGETVNLREFGERDMLVLFWNPACGHCRAMHADVLTLEAGANGVTPRLVVVSSGDEASTRAEGFSSTVLLDRPGGAGTEFGVAARRWPSCSAPTAASPPAWPPARRPCSGCGATDRLRGRWSATSWRLREWRHRPS